MRRTHPRIPKSSLTCHDGVSGTHTIDRHDLALERVIDGEGFDEESTSMLQRRWRHERRLIDTPEGGCVVRDRLVIVPHLSIARPMVARTVRFLFDHRHRILRKRFGT